MECEYAPVRDKAPFVARRLSNVAWQKPRNKLSVSPESESTPIHKQVKGSGQHENERRESEKNE